jgi:ribonuclease P protein component
VLPRKNLIDLKHEFPRLRREGKIFNSPSFGLLISYRSAASHELSATTPCCAFLVSKKIANRSVVRHQVKRKLADAVAPFLPRLPQNIELVFLAKKGAAGSTREEIQLETETTLRRARLL